jgi:hypothetical protein
LLEYVLMHCIHTRVAIHLDQQSPNRCDSNVKQENNRQW